MVTDCVHVDLAAFVTVHRLFDADVGEAVARTRLPDRFSADMLIECAGCGERFVFIGTPAGVSPRQPMASIDGTELRAPVRPVSAPDGWGETGAGITATVDVMPERRSN